MCVCVCAQLFCYGCCYFLSTYSRHSRPSNYKYHLIALGILPLSMFFEYLNISFALGCLHDSSNDSYISSFNILSFICFTDTNSRSSVWQNFVTNYFLAHLKYLATIATKSSNNTPLCFHNSLAVLTNLAIYLLLNLSKLYTPHGFSLCTCSILTLKLWYIW